MCKTNPRTTTVSEKHGKISKNFYFQFFYYQQNLCSKKNVRVKSLIQTEYVLLNCPYQQTCSILEYVNLQFQPSLVSPI